MHTSVSTKVQMACDKSYLVGFHKYVFRTVEVVDEGPFKQLLTLALLCKRSTFTQTWITNTRCRNFTSLTQQHERDSAFEGAGPRAL